MPRRQYNQKQQQQQVDRKSIDIGGKNTHPNGGNDNGTSSLLERIRPIHYVLILCLVVAHYEIKNISSWAREVSESLTTSLNHQKQQSQRQEEVDEPNKNKNKNDSNNNLGCTTLEKRLIQKGIPDDKIIIDATKCPDSSAWLSAYMQQEASSTTTDPFLFLNFGCNKGYDALFVAETISRNTGVFHKQKWADAIGVGHPGNCYQGNSNGNTPIDPTLPKVRSVEIHCIEAMPQTAERLIKATEITQAKANGLHAYNYAMTGSSSQKTMLFPNPTGQAGEEVFGLHHCNRTQWADQCIQVPTKTVDDFVAEHVDNDKNNQKSSGGTKRRIPFLSVDVEGFDFTVLKGATQTLKRTDYLEFEYHSQGDWKRQKLKDAIELLQQSPESGGGGFVCYWSGVNQLWKLSHNCWMEYFEFHQWSNIACVSPQHQPQLFARMEQVFQDTLVQGTAITT